MGREKSAESSCEKNSYSKIWHSKLKVEIKY